MFLPLAEKMTLKYIQEGKLEAEAGTNLNRFLTSQFYWLSGLISVSS